MILVTGGTGLVGSHLLVELASQGMRVKALRRSTSYTSVVPKLFSHYDVNLQNLKFIEWVEGDVDDYLLLKNLLENVTTVYHCAAIVSFRSSDFQRMLSVNVQGTANLVDACVNAGVKELCFVSSVAVLGSPASNGMVDESSLWAKSKGKSGYAISKFQSEMEVRKGIEMGLNATIVNPTVIIGPGRWNSGSGLIFGTIKRGFPFYTTGVTGYVDARDVAQAMISAVEKQQWGQRFVLNGQNLSHQEVFSEIAQTMGKKLPSIKVTPFMSSIAWRFAAFASIFSRKAPALNRETARSGHSKTYYSAKLAEEVLGIQFRKISEAIENTVSAGRL